MKNLILTITCMFFGLSAIANENPFRESLSEYSARIQSDVNPFKEGTEKIVLTELDKQTLAEYALNSKVLLERALRKGTGKALEEATEIYLTAIKKVVMDSFLDGKRSELLMRYALNQALKLTVGTPSADGQRIEEKGVLAGIVNQDVISMILKESIDLAIRYYQNDIEAIRSGNLVSLPYIVFGNERLKMAQDWSHSIHNPSLLLNFQVAMLEQWLSTVANNEVLDRLKIGEAILDVDAALSEVKTTSYSTPKKVRYLRGVIDELFTVLRSLGYRVSARAGGNPALSSDSTSGLQVVADLTQVDSYESLKLINNLPLGLVIGQGYTGKYFYKDPNHWTRPDKNGKTRGPYKSYTEEELIAFMTEKCQSLVGRYSDLNIVCAPVNRVPRAYEYMENEAFQENFTVPFVIGIYTRSYENPSLE